ncbi:hypothetical protein SORBI_3003G358800 [Sorghum bicolor]|uniref:Protein kinase domain-containing protein n=1 Tax=Sorghum bicolor TaxID=4558 RepID=A0A1W0W0G6_SORBI|nr:hypothetical protein SORBI_3003G358800 [Sorghum bicolor]
MQAARNRKSPTGHGGFSGFNSEFQTDPGFSWTSTYTPRSHMVNRKARSSVSFRERVTEILGSWANCFTPRSEIKEAHENPPIEPQDVYASPRSKGEPLEFAQRLNIAIDIVHAIAYLHGYTDHPIIHRDIKSSNILLTEQLRAKVADFGFARLAPENPEATHVSTIVKGTAGYVDPEYLRTSQLTDRSDVYSFGVLLVELITGRRPIERGRGRGRHQRLTTEWALRKCREGFAVVVMDPRMRRTSAVVSAVEKAMTLAAECTAPDRAARPAMRRCAELLWSVRRDLQQEQQRAAAASAGARRHDGSTYAPPSVTSLRQERFENLR